MELKTQALDRVLEALSPALASELDRIVEETRQALEQEFQKRLQAALRDAESSAQKSAEANLQQAVADARESARKQVTEELERQFKKTLDQSTGDLKSEAASERARLQEQLDQWRTFAEAQRQLTEASSQSEILMRFMKLADSFAPALAVYVAKPDGLALWKSRGKAAFPEIVSEETTDPEFYFRIVSVRGKTVAAVCAGQPCKAESLDFLVSSMERAIELFGLRLRIPAPKAGAPGEPADADPKVHAEARRQARLLISEIKLYHEEELKNGRRQRDIYQRLQKEIDHGREQYNQRVPAAVLGGRDYFHEELVRILGEDDVSRLGDAYPGPMSS
jgi:hypothetical protein